MTNNLKKLITCQYGIEVKKALIDNKMTQRQLAEKIGVMPQYISAIIMGRRSSGKYTKRINEILNIKDDFEESLKKKAI